MERFSRMLRSGLAMMLAICMIISACPVVAFATEASSGVGTESDPNTISYVSIGDSMANGYGLPGYDDPYAVNGFMDFVADAYPNQLQSELGFDHIAQLATSAMRAEDLNYILRYPNATADPYTKSEFINGRWNDYEGYDSELTGVSNVAKVFQDNVREADVITMGIGNANFGVFMLGRLTNALNIMVKEGQYEAIQKAEEWVNFENALSKLDATQKQVVMTAYNNAMDVLKSKVPADAADLVDRVGNILGFSMASYMANMDSALDRINELNPDAEIILVAVMNTFEGVDLTFELEGKKYTIPMSSLMAPIVNSVNTYLSGLPTMKHQLGEWTGNTFYFAEAYNVSVIVDTYKTEIVKQDNVIRNRFIEEICENTVFDMVDDMFNEMLADNDMDLALDTTLSREDVEAYEAGKFDDLTANEILSAGVYLGFEKAVLDAADLKTLDATAFLKVSDGLDDVFSDVDADLTNALDFDAITDKVVEDVKDVAVQNAQDYKKTADATEWDYYAEQVRDDFDDITDVAVHYILVTNNTDIASLNEDEVVDWAMEQYEDVVAKSAATYVAADITDPLAETLVSDTTIKSLLNLFARMLIGNGIGCHPSAAGHDTITNAIVEAYKSNHTTEEEVKQDIKYVLDEMKGFLETYGPDAADQLWKVWKEEGYQAIVDETVTELTETATARYEHYKNTVVPALNDTAAALTGQKAQLTEQLTELNVQLAAKKAELEAVIAEQEIGSIHTPDINIDTELGNNEQTQVPENDCEGAGNVADELAAAVSDLEHAIAVIEALIADVQADIDDMVALATEIAAAIAELEKTMESVAAAAMDLKDAFDAIVAVLTNESAQSTTDAFIAAFNTARETAYIAIEALELITETATDDVAAIDASLTALEEGIDALYNNFEPEHAEAALNGVLSVLPEELQFAAGAAALIMEELEIDKQAVMDKLNEELAALEAEYKPLIDAAQAAIDAKKIEIENEIKAKYAEYEQKAMDEIAAKQAEAQAKLDALNTELQGYVTEMEALAEDAAQEVIDGIQAQIDRVNADIAQVNEDLACAVDHINAELKTIHDQIVAEVNAAYADVLAELQKIHDDLVVAYNAAIEALKAAADKAIQDLIDAANKQIEELGDIADDIKDIINGIFQEIRDEIKAVQDAINELLKGNLAAIEDLKQALVDLGLDGVAALVDQLTDLIEELIHQATYADLTLDDGAVYVALGDDTALANGYVEKVASQLEAAMIEENGGVDLWVKNYAKAGNTIAKERENLSDVADAELITIGFGNVNMLKTAIDTALNEKNVSYDWAGLVGADLVPYVQDALADVYAEIDATIPNEEMAAYAKAAVESIAYSAVEYAVELPQLIAEIREVNADALIIIVGQYNPMGNAVLDLLGDGTMTLDLSEYIGYFVDAVAAHGIAYSLISGDAIFAEAPDVYIEETDTKWSVIDLLKMLKNDFATLNPSEAGDVYIANQILKALNLTQLKEELVLFKDVHETDFFYEPVMWAVKMGITTGYTDEIFAPDDSCTRAHVVTFLWRAAGKPAPKSNNMPFVDVPDDYYTEAVIWAAENEIIFGTGDGTTFEPHRACTRAEIVTMLSRYLDAKASSSNNPFVDVPDDYFTDAVIWAAENDITKGTGDGTTFEPNRACNRGEIVTFLFRALHPSPKPGV